LHLKQDNGALQERWSCDVKLSGKDEEMKVHWLSGCSEFHSKLFVMHWFEFQVRIMEKAVYRPESTGGAKRGRLWRGPTVVRWKKTRVKINTRVAYIQRKGLKCI